jgi:hypothetical protein
MEWFWKVSGRKSRVVAKNRFPSSRCPEIGKQRMER